MPVRIGLLTLFAAHLLAFAFAACDNDGSSTDALCEPGTNVFCRCPGGEAGTRACLDSGENFAECVVAPEVPCGDRVECEAGEEVFCLCPDGTEGLKECLRDGTGFGQCKLASGEPCPEGSSETSSTTTGGGGNGSGGSTGVGGSGPACSHDVCSTGPALSSDCGSCEAAVCAADPYCCDSVDGKWDAVCVGVADTECDNVCNPTTECAHDVCTTGDALTDGCSACVTSVCTSDSFCCDEESNIGWDALCVEKVKDGAVHPDCSGLCCEHSECSEGAGLDPECSVCAGTVCEDDPYCCDNEWDSLCVSAASQVVSCNCQ